MGHISVRYLLALAMGTGVWLSAYEAHIINETDQPIHAHLEVAGTVDWPLLGTTCTDQKAILQPGETATLDYAACCIRYFSVRSSHNRGNTAHYDAQYDACRSFIFIIHPGESEDDTLQIEEAGKAGLERLAALIKEVGSSISHTFMEVKNRLEGKIGYYTSKDEPAAHQEYTYTKSYPRQEPDDIRLMSLNYQPVNYAQREWDAVGTAKVWYLPHRLGRFRDLLRNLKPDVFALQEINEDWSMGEGFADLVQPFPLRFAHEELSFATSLSNPHAYDTTRFRLIDKELIADKEEIQDPQEANPKETLITKITLYDTRTLTQFSTINVHLRGDAIANSKPYKLIAEHVRDAHARGEQCFVIGDFNTDNHSARDRLRTTLNEEIDIQAITLDAATYVGYGSEKPNPYAKIDTILYNAEAPLKPVQTGVIIFSDEMDEDGYMQHENRISDHRPVLADFRKTE